MSCCSPIPFLIITTNIIIIYIHVASYISVVFQLLGNLLVCLSVPARLGKGQGAKEIGHNLAREQPKFGHNLVRERHIIGHSLEHE